MFQAYLTGTLLLYALQAFAQVRLYRALVAAPRRWPRLSRLLSSHLRTVAKFNIALLAILTGGLWIAWLALRHLAWPQASLPPAALLSQPALLVPAIVCGAIMVFLDVRGLLRLPRGLRPRTERLLTITEWLVRHDPTGAVHTLASWRIRWWLTTQAPHARRWLLVRLLEVSSRLAFGATLGAAAARTA